MSMCPIINNEPRQWWCGKNEDTEACQSGTDGRFDFYTSGSILGFPPLISSTSAAITNSSDSVTTTFFTEPSSEIVTVQASSPARTVTVPASSPVKISTDPPLSAQTQDHSTNLLNNSSATAQDQEHSTSLPTAIGVGIGVPLGIAAIGFLGFLFWKETRWQRISRSRKSREPAPKNGEQSVTVAMGRF